MFKKSLCKFEEKNKKCEYVLICPFYHKHDVNNNGVIANVIAIVKFHKKNLLKGIKIQQGKIESYKKILSSHQCGICHSFLAYSYNELDCGSRCILCKDCTERFREMNKCLKCNTDYSKVQEFRIKTKN